MIAVLAASSSPALFQLPLGFARASTVFGDSHRAVGSFKALNPTFSLYMWWGRTGYLSPLAALMCRSSTMIGLADPMGSTL